MLPSSWKYLNLVTRPSCKIRQRKKELSRSRLCCDRNGLCSLARGLAILHLCSLAITFSHGHCREHSRSKQVCTAQLPPAMVVPGVGRAPKPILRVPITTCVSCSSPSQSGPATSTQRKFPNLQPRRPHGLTVHRNYHRGRLKRVHTRTSPSSLSRASAVLSRRRSDLLSPRPTGLDSSRADPTGASPVEARPLSPRIRIILVALPRRTFGTRSITCHEPSPSIHRPDRSLVSTTISRLKGTLPPY